MPVTQGKTVEKGCGAQWMRICNCEVEKSLKPFPPLSPFIYLSLFLHYLPLLSPWVLFPTGILFWVGSSLTFSASQFMVCKLKHHTFYIMYFYVMFSIHVSMWANVCVYAYKSRYFSYMQHIYWTTSWKEFFFVCYFSINIQIFEMNNLFSAFSVSVFDFLFKLKKDLHVFIWVSFNFHISLLQIVKFINYGSIFLYFLVEFVIFKHGEWEGRCVLSYWSSWGLLKDLRIRRNGFFKSQHFWIWGP